MRIIMVSADNSKARKVGGKHIHQELLEAGFLELGENVETVYPTKTNHFVRRCINYALRHLTDQFQYYESVGYYQGIIKNLRKKLSKTMERDVSDVVFLAEDVLAACAVGREAECHSKVARIVTTLHGYFARESRNYNRYSDRNKDKIFESDMSWEREAIAYSDALIVVDTNLERYARSELSFSREIYVVYNAIDTRRFFSPDQNQVIASRSAIGIPSDIPLILVARRLVRKNGVNFALEAAYYLEKMGVRFLMAVVGAGPEGSKLKAYAEDLKLSLVVFVGPVDHDRIDSYYKAADIILLPSTKSDDVEEATSLSMLEGMACGKPVVATEIGGLKDVIQDGVNGYLVPDQSPEIIANKIKSILADKAETERIGRTAAEHVLREHSYLKHAQRIAAILEQIWRLS